MADFLKRISSRKFLLALFVQAAALASMVFRPEAKEAWAEIALTAAEFAALLLAGLGYGKIEGDVDKARAANGG